MTDDIAQTLKRLREQDGMLAGLPERQRLPFSLWPDGLPRGALVNFWGPAGSGKAQAALCFAQQSGGRLAWLEPCLSAYPPAFVQLGISLCDVLFIETSQRLPWSLLQVLRSQLFTVTVALVSSSQSQTFSDRDYRRFQLAAERAGTTLLLLSEQPLKSWVMSMHLRVSREGDLLQMHEERRGVVAGVGA